MRDRLRRWLAPPQTGRPADTLRWVRRLHLVIAPLGLLVSAELLAEGASWWWIGIGSTGLALLGAATTGPSIRRAEARGRLDPATAPERRRRARRITASYFAVMAIVSVGLFYVLLGLGAAIFLAVMWLVSGPLGLWLARRWGAGAL